MYRLYGDDDKPAMESLERWSAAGGHPAGDRGEGKQQSPADEVALAEAVAVGRQQVEPGDARSPRQLRRQLLRSR